MPARKTGLRKRTTARRLKNVTFGATLCGKPVVWGAKETAQGYGYRCLLDIGHTGACSEGGN